MPRLMIYGSRLHGYTFYAHGLWSDPIKWIIWRITCKRKSANILSYVTYYKCLYCRYLMIPVICATSVVCLTLTGIYDSSHISRLVSHFLTPVDVTTSVISTNSSRIMTPVDESHHDSGWWACRMSYHLCCERIFMAGLDDCSIL
jgi:hypothetical protein